MYMHHFISFCKSVRMAYYDNDIGNVWIYIRTEFEPKVSTATATTYLFIIVVHYLLHHKLTTAPENSMSNVTASMT